MSARSEHLDENAGMLICYGKDYDVNDDDCSDCPQSFDCETLTELHGGRRKKQRVAKMPPVKFRRAEEEEEEIPWAEPEHAAPQTCQSPWQQKVSERAIPVNPQFTPQQYIMPTAPPPVPHYENPGLHSSAHIMNHPAPHLTYMVSNPIDCPMPSTNETWYARIGKNALSGALSEGGRQFYEFFRRFRF